MKRSSLRFLACVVATLGVIQFTPRSGAADHDSAAGNNQDSEITLQLRLSVQAYDPENPTGRIACVVRNGSKAAIELPAEYDGRTVVLYGMGRGHRGGTRLWRRGRDIGDEEPKVITIAAGKEAKLFDLPLAELLTSTSGRERRWGWDWRFRFEPPRTPIHQWRQSGYVESADFWVEVQHDDSKIVSKKTNVAVQSTDGDRNKSNDDQAADAAKRKQLWKELLRACPEEYLKIDAYGESTDLTQVLFRSQGTTLLFSSGTAKVEPVDHMKKLGPINRITFQENDREGRSFLLWYNGVRELTLSVRDPPRNGSPRELDRKEPVF